MAAADGQNYADSPCKIYHWQHKERGYTVSLNLCTWVVVSCCCKAARSPEECILLWRAVVSEAPGIETGADVCLLPELAASSAVLCSREPPAAGLAWLLLSRECLLLAACCVRAYASCTAETWHLQGTRDTKQGGAGPCHSQFWQIAVC